MGSHASVRVYAIHKRRMNVHLLYILCASDVIFAFDPNVSFVRFAGGCVTRLDACQQIDSFDQKRKVE